ncbi:type I methionyl aminopeptidase [Megasphaera vaginalis (ex Srinivasan et al. 2021)]|uniref:Methionine aminopeptidase n=1 Tax=Megasphaera vaginalis (ex Srinivasan et al. 2021) TaxID=1111454 RepID=U7UM77_9FIRM|nr:type I methionyl aminopeptidase [Megasphaera vaginalis (ex Srinivasan et al. 2021)]ERT60522.1 methionine aminopeptidase, type I [Megasphaera vaginalis (ex Srinivasan et al. 2021)]
MIILKSKREIEYIREAGRITADALVLMRQLAKPGVTTAELDLRCEEYIRSRGAFPSCKGYYGYPATICASVNEEVVHGIPGRRKLRDGDIISVDLVVNKDGYHGDSTVTIPVGRVKPAVLQLLKVTEECLYKGIQQAVAGNHIGDIGHAVQSYAESFGYGVVRDYVGHGIGTDMHEEPEVPNYGTADHGELLENGMVLAIEPMINMGTEKVRQLKNGWTVVTQDKQWAAHFEHTIAITENGPEILTLPS